MKISPFYSILSIFVVLLSCVGPKETDERYNESFRMHPSTYQADFTGYDSDSTWKLSIRFGEEVVFTSKTDKIIFRGKADEEFVAQGADIVMVKAQNETHEIIVAIDVQTCNQDGKIINLAVKDLKTGEEKEYRGCGIYNGSPKLFDIWVLMAINNEPLDSDVFRIQLPFMEINLRDKRIMGFGGCNEFNGSISFVYKKIVFGPIASTRKYCNDISEYEEKLFGLLNGGALNYSFRENILILESTQGSLTFKKVD
jgi:heat shock protein HslJ